MFETAKPPAVPLRARQHLNKRQLYRPKVEEPPGIPPNTPPPDAVCPLEKSSPSKEPEQKKPSSRNFAHSVPIHVAETTSLLSRFRNRNVRLKCECGRPLHDDLHTLKWGGLKHLMMIVLFLGSLRLLWIDSHIKGVKFALRQAGFHSVDLKYCLYLFVMNLIYPLIAMSVETVSARLLLPPPTQKSKQQPLQPAWGVVALVHIFNASTCLILSSVFSYRYIWNPLIGTICEANTIITFLKLSSYCLAMCELRKEYFGGSKVHEYYGDSSYPNNLTSSNVVYFWFAPTLVYQPVYPRTESVRWTVLLSLLGEACTGLFFIWMLIVKVDTPILKDVMIHYQNRDLQLVDDFIKLCAANITIWLLGFFVIFQSTLNLLAEATRFADREFYRDWWNAGCLGTYWRDWNLPVANYLRRHIYYPLRRRGINSTLAAIVVFLLSAALHELLVGVATKNFNGVAFFSMVAQVPLVKLTAPLEKIRGPGTTIGNCVFWLSILLGQPTGLIIYYISWTLKFGQKA